MRRVIVSSYVTLDGRVDELQDWTIPYSSDAAVAYHCDLLRNSDGLLLGRRTYEIFAAIWPPRAGELPYIDQLNGMAKHVATTTVGALRWQNSHRIEGDVAEGVAELKRRPGQNLVVYGCRDLTRTLQEHDLVDEYRLLVHPVMLGKGRTLLPDGARQVRLDLTGTTVIAPGVVVLTYQPVR
jgi:dihydrofolate reductase